VPGQPALDPSGPLRYTPPQQDRDCQLLLQLGQPFGGFTQRLEWIVGIGQASPSCRSRHKLRDPFGSDVAARARIKSALLPNEPGEEFRRQIIGHRFATQAMQMATGKLVWSIPPTETVGSVRSSFGLTKAGSLRRAQEEHFVCDRPSTFRPGTGLRGARSRFVGHGG
jgi:hypothetical protein